MNQYLLSLRYNVAQCDFILESIGWPTDHREDDQQNCVDFVYDLKLGYQREIADLSAGEARQGPGMVV